MIKIKDIKPIPKYVIKKIKQLDDKQRFFTENTTRYYSYLTKMNKDLAQVVVACKIKDHQWFCKQVVIHAVNSEMCFVRDIEYSLFGYTVGWYNQGLTHSPKRYDDNKWYDAEDKYYNVICPIVNKKYALSFDKYKYSAVDKYKFLDVIKYLRIYEKYPQAEYLVKMNLCQFATNKTLLKQIGKDKNFRKWIVKNKVYLQNEYGLYPYVSSRVILNAYKKDLSIENAQILDRKIKNLQNDYNYQRTISKHLPKKEMVKFIEYLEKQETSCSSYTDYLNACLYLNLDMNEEKNRYPHDFKRWHDIRIDQYHTAKAEKDKQERKKLYNKFEKVAKKYAPLERLFVKDDYICIIAVSPNQLIYEGEQLNHCVGRMNYDQKFAREESLIFFIRNRLAPNTPLVTLEYSIKNKKILQCYGYGDTKPAEDILNFANKVWLPYANRKLKKIA